MARILIGTVPVVGHINPFLPLVRALVAHGHEVRWYTGAKYRPRVEATGATVLGMPVDGEVRDMVPQVVENYDHLGLDGFGASAPAKDSRVTYSRGQASP